MTDRPALPPVVTTGAVPTVVTPRGTAAPGRLWLVVIGPERATQRALPEDGELVIGRSSQCSVHVDDVSVSRRHAVFRVGARLEVEDLGSANGTRVHGLSLRPGEPYPLQPGEVVEVGAVLVVVQRRAAERRVFRVWEHDYFEGRLDEECARTVARGGRLALVRLSCGRAPSLEELEAALGEGVLPGDVAGRYGPSEIELLLVDRSAEAAQAAGARAAEALTAAGIPSAVSVARFPEDARDAAGLLARVFGASGAAPDGADDGAVAENPTMRELDRLVERVAPADISVLILGETGVGKDVLAARVHALSQRTAGPLLRLNCAALSEALLESELFGHEKGAFTGAMAAKPGLLESAQGGTVLLDEIGELPPATQAKLLRVLEDREVRRVGGLKGRKIDVRFVGATNRDLEADAAAGRFRQDLYFRIAGVTLVVPPLRERVAEIEPLARTFVKNACAAAKRAEPAIAPAALELLVRYPWPGNVRELRNAMERAVLLCTGAVLDAEHLPAAKMRATIHGGRASAPARAPEEVTAPVKLPAEAPPGRVKEQLQELERQRILEALEKCGGNQKEAAALLGLSRRTLLHRLDAYGVPRPRKR